jgi:hypothetical protein
MTLEKEIVQLLKEKGPLTGSEIWDAVGGDQFALWRACMLSKDLSIQRIGTRYLRLDRRVKGFARLSPSILREFLTYSVIGSAEDLKALALRAQQISLRIEEVSRTKSQLAYSVVSALANQLETELPIKEEVSFIIAGDIVYNMAHDVPRPERSTGKLVKGSDMDLVVVVDDRFPQALTRRLDEAIYGEKYRLLITPHIREEIDYVVKNMERVREQLGFDTYRHMVACKIMEEGTLLYGSERIFRQIKSMLKERGIIEKLRAMEQEAQQFREEAEKYLVLEGEESLHGEDTYLFYPSEESEEFE